MMNRQSTTHTPPARVPRLVRQRVSRQPPYGLPHFLVALVLSLAAIGSNLARAADQEPSVLVTLARVQPGSQPRTISTYGTVQADPSTSWVAAAPASASVTRLFVRLGETVEPKAALVELTANPQARAAFAAAQSALEAASVRLRRTHELYAQFLATNQDLADAKKAQSDARAALAALQALGSGGSKTLTAPFRAVVTQIDTSTGSLVAEGTSLLELAPPDSLILRVGAVPSDAIAIAPGNAVSIHPVGTDLRLSARVSARGGMVSPIDGLVPIDIALPNNSLLPGQTAEATITTTVVRGFVVPHRSVLIDDAGRPYIVQVVNRLARLVPVRILDENSTRDVVDGKVDPDAPVVLTGAHQLQNGMRVRLAPSKPPGR